MPARFCTTTTRKLITFLGLASFGMAITLPATAQMVASSGEINQPADNNSQPQQLLKATPGISLVAQSGVRTIADELETANDAFSTLSAAISAAGLTSALAGRGPFTIFAPIDEAFAALPSGTVQTLLRPENKARLTRILTYHVVPGKINTFGLTPGSTLRLRTLAGQPLTVRVTDASEVFVNNVPVIMADIPATNGMIHGISAVLMP
ncbi:MULTISPECIES: fasciclin domain-containing protein [unclassified Coleofasciculus]|uniref:fasciclin domain-containing protein n=1 Tax=unclassified Coleofasciculus TaxID=2692782 RepID=UPI001882C46B|nr:MULTISPECIES: fasciclin domain-containing protein [unclassified Coleofasciculus]MBE9129223.1 fasciclin domain-containing protein [Coleofasciculus sp. LEGE 07081]MBE9151897.1 fasciclin domain-containing protein [Coleofasciculus sp. LEGE 07092]